MHEKILFAFTERIMTTVGIKVISHKGGTDTSGVMKISNHSFDFIEGYKNMDKRGRNDL